MIRLQILIGLLCLTLISGCAIGERKPSSISDNLTIVSPQDYRVFQRDSADIGKVNFSIHGNFPDSVIRIVALNSNKGIVKEIFMSTPIGSTDFRGSIDLPVGGWYTLLIQNLSSSMKKVLSENQVAHIGVGEVFIAAGQSNSLQIGENAQESSDLTSAAYLNPSGKDDGSEASHYWVHRIDLDVSKTFGSPWPIFTSKLEKKLHMPVAIMSVGCGGTQVAQWLPESEGALPAILCGPDTISPGGLYLRLVKATRILGSFRAVLWHNGESDSIENVKKADYYSRFNLMMNQLNKDNKRSKEDNNQIKWVVSKASYVPGKEIVDPLKSCDFTMKPYQYAPGMLQVRRAQQQLWDEGLAYEGPDTDGLIGMFRYPGKFGNCIHFSDIGLKYFGDFWYKAISESGIVPGTENASSLKLRKSKIPIFRHSNGSDFIFNTVEANPLHYKLDGVAFHLFTEPFLGSRQYFSCWFQKTGHFVSYDPNCEGFEIIGPLGYGVDLSRPIGLKPLYRFVHLSKKAPIFFSTTSLDEGLKANYVYQGFQGFVP